MPVVEFLADGEGSAYGWYAEVSSRADLERVFFLNEEDRRLIERRRGEHMRLGFSLRLVAVRWVKTFLEDPLGVPARADPWTAQAVHMPLELTRSGGAAGSSCEDSERSFVGTGVTPASTGRMPAVRRGERGRARRGRVRPP
ncbi:DUF4158 domain-containing protein [Streptosporangium sp. NPDC006007]|uniref:DUF4158 domain-containing protein n=1 Tax=Streptosporangium sp. NPDC006007 TaxID=3154575 RepID=UPI0033B2C332